MINLLNSLGKVYEKVAADMVADWYEVHQVLHEGQIDSQQ